MRGRKPKPTAQRVLEGNPGKRKLNAAEAPIPVPPDAFDEPPTGLGVNAHAVAMIAEHGPAIEREHPRGARNDALGCLSVADLEFLEGVAERLEGIA